MSCRVDNSRLIFPFLQYNIQVFPLLDRVIVPVRLWKLFPSKFLMFSFVSFWAFFVSIIGHNLLELIPLHTKQIVTCACFNSLNAKIAIIYKPVHWFAEQLNRLVSTGCPVKKYIQLWRSVSNIFFQQKSLNIYKYNTLMSAILTTTHLFTNNHSRRNYWT